jgi:ankyrin repeat protein
MPWCGGCACGGGVCAERCPVHLAAATECALCPLSCAPPLSRSETDFLFGVDEAGMTLLHHAAKHGRIGVTKWLVRHAANIHARDRNGATPLLVAVVGNHVSVVR